MESNVKKQLSVTLVTLLIGCGIAWAETECQIVATTKTVEVGEPLPLKIIIRRGKLTRSPFPHTLRLKVSPTEEAGNDSSVYTVRPKNVRKGSLEGEYVCNIMLWLDLWGKDPFRPVFTQTGRYEICVEGYEPSGVINVDVIPASAKTIKAISFLADPNDLAFLLAPSAIIKDKAHRMAKAEEIVAQCGDTTIGQMIAARLGVEYFWKMKKDGEAISLKAERKRTGRRHPLFDKAYLYVNKGLKLADEFTVREELLLHLAALEYINNDYEKANMSLDELVQKYPQGKHGERGLRAKEELKQFKEKEGEGGI